MLSALVRKKLFKHKPGQAIVESYISILTFAAFAAFLVMISSMLFVYNAFAMSVKVGARAGAVDPALANGDTSGVEQTVIDFIQQSTNITIPANAVTVTGPVGPVGNRTVTVDLNYDLNDSGAFTPLFTAVDGVVHTNFSQPGTFTLNTSAVMRYEE